MKQCVLHADKICSDCGECDDRCMLDPQKICDNCFKCLETDAKPYAEIKIDGVYLNGEPPKQAEESPAAPDLEGGYILDSDEDWRDGMHIHVRTLKRVSASRARCRHEMR